jgi:hypothetical protein
MGSQQGRRVLAVLLPVIVVSGLIFIAILVAMMFVGSMGFFGGVRT